jgi:hypothetical protein
MVASIKGFHHSSPCVAGTLQLTSMETLQLQLSFPAYILIPTPNTPTTRTNHQ